MLPLGNEKHAFQIEAWSTTKKTHTNSQKKEMGSEAWSTTKKKEMGSEAWRGARQVGVKKNE